jgi:tetratricopeptide (TPR) repeat protein
LFILDALNDSNNAIQLDETNIKAYLRKGTALYNQDSKEEALKTFIRGLELDCKLILFYLLIFFLIFYFSC